MIIWILAQAYSLLKTMCPVNALENLEIFNIHQFNNPPRSCAPYITNDRHLDINRSENIKKI